MANYNFRAPALPIPPIEYDQNQQNQFENALRLYFNRLDNYNVDASQNFTLNLNTLPTEVSLATLQPGDVYRDTTAGNTLKVKV
jgi:hypothetical protein